VLDAAALHLAACPAGAPFTARLCVQMGFTCLRKLTRTLRSSSTTIRGLMTPSG